MDHKLLIKAILTYHAIFACFFVVTMAVSSSSTVLIVWTLILIFMAASLAVGLAKSANRLNFLPILGPIALGAFFIANDLFGVSFGMKIDILVLPLFAFTLGLYVFLTYKSRNDDGIVFKENR
ncbi:hypothetical protein [Qipengyuania mesophila]|uniref:hypothetical protein n=1 Tax=Qipengyuania mesophila TaxID=2867246 RepID=UPI0035191691